MRKCPPPANRCFIAAEATIRARRAICEAKGAYVEIGRLGESEESWIRKKKGEDGYRIDTAFRKHAKCKYATLRPRAIAVIGETMCRTYSRDIFLLGNNTHGRTSGLIKSDDFSNARVKGAPAGGLQTTPSDLWRSARTMDHFARRQHVVHA